ncbi:MAG: hypothetical protein RR192_04255 [Peptostreptococcaceae bacterium]
MGRKKVLDRGDLNIKFRLNRIYSKIANESKWSMFDDFMVWALTNGYKPWKVLAKLDEEENYSEENCYWKLDSTVRINSMKPIEEEDTPTNVCRYIKSISSGIAVEVMTIRKIQSQVEEIRKSDNIVNIATVIDLERDVQKILDRLKEVNMTIEKIDLKGDIV